MKKHLAALALALALVFSIPAVAQPTGLNHNLKAVTTTATGAWINTDGNCVTAVAWSASTSSATVVLEQSNDGTIAFIPGNGTTDGTFTDPSSTATSLGCFMAKFSRLRVSAHSTGTISGDLSWFKASPTPANVTTINNVTITKPASRATLTIASGKTATISKSLTLTGTDTTTMTFPTTSATIARTDAANTFTGTHTFGQIVDSGLTATRIPFAGASGLLVDAANFTYTTATGALVNTNGTAPSISTQRFLSTGTAPAVTNTTSNSCGTTAATIAGKDQASHITVGATSGTSCTVTFNVAFANAPVCVASATVATDLTVATTTTTAIVAGTLTAAEKIHLLCFGY